MAIQAPERPGMEALKDGFRGSILMPADEGYDEARRIWNGTIDRQPAVIARCEGVADAIEAVNYARESGLSVAVRGGGHHVAGASINDAGVVVDLSQMRSVRVDPVSLLVRAEGGAQIGDLDRETQAFNLAVPMGAVSETGIAGLTLAGGLGWMRRKYGLSCDNLVSADVVIASGEVVTANAEDHADLFWALRGGGWDMGVVTSFEFKAYPLGSDVMLVFTAYPAEDGQQVLAAFRDFMGSAPPEVAPIAVYWTFPENEAFPEEIWGRQFIGIVGPYAGPLTDGERVMQPLRELGTPLFDGSGPTPWVTVQHFFDEDYPKGLRYYWKSTYLEDLSEGAIETILRLGARRPSPATSLDVWPLGGAIGAVGSADTPIAQRDAPFLIGCESNWIDQSDDVENVAWAREAVEALAPFSTGASYLNFEDLSGAGVVAASHGSNLERMRQIKNKYDPGNLFRSRRGLVD
jgi:FAD binding domain/Berberine and berberine like